MLNSLHHTKLAVALLTTMLAVLPGCATYPSWLASSGPSTEKVLDAEEVAKNAPVSVINLSDEVARKVSSSIVTPLFSEAFYGESQPVQTVSYGDTLEISVWEAPPATLFGTGAAEFGGVSGSGMATFPEQMVSVEGTISIPFAGTREVAGMTPHEVQKDIARALRNKANHPQVMVRVLDNAASNVTVVGEVNMSKRMPLTAKGERLLDALAEAGGVKQPVNKVTIQVTRDERVVSLPLETIIRDPQQNVVLWPGDVITALYQPSSFTVLGAAGLNQEVNFETQGITLAQALARSGGTQDNRADAKGVFIFRFETPEALVDPTQAKQRTTDGRVPVIYRVDLSNPATFFVAQNFPMRDKDVLYVANASGYELQKFLNIIFSGLYPTLSIVNATN